MSLGKRIKSIRMEEGLSQAELSQLTDIPIDSIKAYESERRSVNEGNLIKITCHPQFFKYALWLTTGQTAPESGQVCPEFSIQEKCGLIVDVAEKRA